MAELEAKELLANEIARCLEFGVGGETPGERELDFVFMQRPDNGRERVVARLRAKRLDGQGAGMRFLAVLSEEDSNHKDMVQIDLSEVRASQRGLCRMMAIHTAVDEQVARDLLELWELDGIAQDYLDLREGLIAGESPTVLKERIEQVAA